MSPMHNETDVERQPAVLHFCNYINQSALPDDFKTAMKQARIAKVEISSAEKKWRVHLGLDTIVRKRLIDQFASEMTAEIDELETLTFVIKYSMPELVLENIIHSYWEDVVYYISKNHPVLARTFISATYKVVGKKMQIFVNNQVAGEIIKLRNVTGQISELLEQEFGLDVQVNVIVLEQNDCLVDNLPSEQESNFVKALLERKNETGDGGGEPHSGTKGQAVEKANRQKYRKRKTRKSEPGALKGKAITGEPVIIQEVVEEEKSMTVQGRIINLEVRRLNSGRNIVSFDITDLTDSITVKFFEDEKEKNMVSGNLKKGMWVKVRGPVQQDTFSKELTLMAWDINLAEFESRLDDAVEKRVELHFHTKMSAMDGFAGVSDAVALAAKWGHPAVAITDHGVVQAFPDAYEAGKRHNIKILYGMEGYLINDGAPIIVKPHPRPIIEEEFVVFDLETTGFSPIACEIIEIGAVKIKASVIIDRFARFVRPQNGIPSEIQKLTGIFPETVANAEPVENVLPKFMEFVGAATLVAHNAQFDAGFIRVNLMRQAQTNLNNSVLDTLGLARSLLPKLKNHKLKNLAKEFGIPLEKHHRAVDDAEATASIFLKLLTQLPARNISLLTDINDLTKDINLDKLRSNHIVLLVQNQIGLRNLYHLVTMSHLNFFYRHPRIPRSELVKRREGLIIGSACEAGELFSAYLDGANQEKIEEIASFYDYLEIQPVTNNEFLVRQGRVKGNADLQQLNRNIVELGTKLNKPVVATSDVHFLEPSDGFYRQVLMAGSGFADADNPDPLYFKTTEEMLGEFSYLGKEKAHEVVITNPRLIADQIDHITPIENGFFPPEIEGADEQISSMTRAKAASIYGEMLPSVVSRRVEKELESIISNGFAVLYLTAHKLVKKSNEDGYLVGSRGSVGSSFVATMTGITEVNPLPPHYVCPNCKYSEFIEDGSCGCGADLPDKNCPECGERLKKDGFDIPFEVFLGFEGDKVPDIDLNFSGDYQPRAHKYTEELFGEGYVFRAGTIGTIADKTAYGFVHKYMEERGFRKRKPEMDRLIAGCTGVKRTTGQHPGGVMVVPRNKDVHDFTPLQYPADDKKSGIITTHFDYHSISGRIVKLDILGHDDPTVIKMLEDLTGLDARTIPLDEPQTMKLFSGVEVMGVSSEQIRSSIGSYGIPEFGTKFVRQMLEDTRPTTFSELVRISGFSHGTDVWLNNAQELIKNSICPLAKAISTRDDIMLYLIYTGLQPERAFKIMEGVRKGKGIKPDDEAYMVENKVPEWYIGSCKKIKYMFPKAHAVAYVMMAYRIAYFKVYYPEAFYTTYFTVRADEFDADIVVQGSHAVRQKIEEIENKLKTEAKKDVTAKEKNLVTILEVALEMYERGIRMTRVNLLHSDDSKFLITENGIIPPFAALQGLGETAARNIVRARKQKVFTSVEDLRIRAKLSKVVIEMMQNHGCLGGLPETDQMVLF